MIAPLPLEGTNSLWMPWSINSVGQRVDFFYDNSKCCLSWAKRCRKTYVKGFPEAWNTYIYIYLSIYISIYIYIYIVKTWGKNFLILGVFTNSQVKTPFLDRDCLGKGGALSSLKLAFLPPENGWLEDDCFLFGWPIFRDYVSLREGNYQVPMDLIIYTLDLPPSPPPSMPVANEGLDWDA